MKRLWVLLMGFAAVAVVGSVAAVSASGAGPCGKCLPTILFLPGVVLHYLNIETEPDHAGNTIHSIPTSLQSASGAKLTGTGFSLLLSWTNLQDMSDGSYLVLFLEVEE